MKTLAFLAALLVAGLAPAPQKKWPAIMPPLALRSLPEEGAMVRVLYVPTERVQAFCIERGLPAPPLGVSWLGCTVHDEGGSYKIEPNPCDAMDESRAALACHENGHVIHNWVHP